MIGSRARRVLAACAAVCLGSGALAACAFAECANGSLREAELYASRLPDCRVYEQVSPVNKNAVDALGAPGFVQASPSGDGVTFFSLSPFPSGPGAEVGGSGEFPTYLGTRGAGGWTTQGLLPPSNPGPESLLLGWTEDLAKTVVSSREPLLAEPPPGALPGVFHSYLHDNYAKSYQWFVGGGEPFFVAATPDDSHILFEDTAQVLPGVTDEEELPYLYEWDATKPPAERVSFVGVVEGGAPEQGTVAGAGSAEQKFYAENTISADGRRIFFTDRGSGKLYMREPAASKTVAVSAGAAEWRASTPDGRFAMYTEGGNLFRFNVATEVREEVTSGAAGVLGTLGIASDGTYAYFVATGVLASGAKPGQENLYEWHAGAIVFIAALKAGLEQGDEANWLDRFQEALKGAGEKSSRVAPSGRTVLFSSREALTGYDNAQHTEFYLYDAERPVSASNPACLSCNPSGVPATSSVSLVSQTDQTTLPSVAGLFLTRNLAADGSRVFFETEEALVPEDGNGQMDVYEWEREGSGSCQRSSERFVASSGGCLYLVSTGQSGQVSYLGDASANGDDVFFFTRQRLVGEDQDNNADLYAARVGGGLAAQNPPPAPSPCSGETCRGTLGAPPVFGAPSSSTFSGAGNIAPPTSTPTGPKPLTRAQKLAKALKLCRKKPRRKRRACESAARARYARKAARSGRAHRAAGRRRV